MEWVKLLQDAIHYMEMHLMEKINYEDVAKCVCMSSYNFHRTFSMVTGMTANEYIRNRRLSLAGQELQMKKLSVINAAYKYGYETPESFSKAFSRFHGVTPRQAQQKGSQLRLFNPLTIKITVEGGTIMDYRMEQGKNQKFIALVRDFRNEMINDESDHSIPDFWGECHEKNLIDPIRNLRPEGKRDLYGLCSPTKEGAPTFSYGIGVIIDADTKQDTLDELVKEGFMIWETEPIEYVVFKCYGENGDCISDTWSRFYKEFLPQTAYEQTENTDFEIYYEKGEKGLFCELWIPVKKK